MWKKFNLKGVQSALLTHIRGNEKIENFKLFFVLDNIMARLFVTLTLKPV